LYELALIPLVLLTAEMETPSASLIMAPVNVMYEFPWLRRSPLVDLIDKISIAFKLNDTVKASIAVDPTPTPLVNV